MEHIAKLTPEQRESWRRVLAMQIGPVAFMLSNDMLQKHRDEMQVAADKLATCQECNSDEKRAKWTLLRQECPSCHGTGDIEDGS